MYDGNVLWTTVKRDGTGAQGKGTWWKTPPSLSVSVQRWRKKLEQEELSEEYTRKKRPECWHMPSPGLWEEEERRHQRVGHPEEEARDAKKGQFPREREHIRCIRDAE